jgi:hypothetical protein
MSALNNLEEEFLPNDVNNKITTFNKNKYFSQLEENKTEYLTNLDELKKITDLNNLTKLNNNTNLNFNNVKHIISSVKILIELNSENNITELNDHNEYLIKVLLSNLKNYLSELDNDSNLLLVVKALFHELIVKKNYTTLVEVYNDIFTDLIYDKLSNELFVPVIPEDWIQQKIVEYKNSLNTMLTHQMFNKKINIYTKKEIVGAKDKEGRWWMAQILAVYNYNNHYVYYVEFLGWGEKFNEFITDKMRLSKFNKKKHNYFRSVWDNEVNEVNDDNEEN